MDLLETLEALRPLQSCVQRLVAETDARGRVECEGLVGKALAHEHLRRRRCGLLLPHNGCKKHAEEEAGRRRSM